MSLNIHILFNFLVSFWFRNDTILVQDDTR